MGTEKQSQQILAPETEAEDILDRQYHDIGIAAVAAACRYLHQPEPEAADHDQADKAH